MQADLIHARLRQTTEVAIHDRADIGACRRVASGLALQMGLDPMRVSDISIAATELASNVVKHARKGWVLIHADAFEQDLHLIAVDRGPGMHDIAACLKDGFSTAGTCGNGLGAVKRLADNLEIYSHPNEGTIVAAIFGRISIRGTPENAGRRPPYHIGAINLPIAGESRCGDDWMVHWENRILTCVVVDGLGHGEGAAHAAEAATSAARDYMDCDVACMLQRVHEQLRGTRGAAAAIARIDPRAGRVQYAGIGNIAARIVRAGDKTQHLISLDGIVGAASIRTIRAYEYQWHPSATLVMHSDGLTSRSASWAEHWTEMPPVCLAARLWRDFSRGRDDATVVVLRQNDSAGGCR